MICSALKIVQNKWPGDGDRRKRMSIIEDDVRIE